VEALAPKQLLDLKMPYQAVLNAAVNFEREVKRQAAMADDRTATLENLFDQPRFNLSKDRLRQLDTLRRIRNNILHGFETLVDPVEAAALVAAFDRAASWFDPANVEPVEPTKDEVKAPMHNEAEEPAKDEVEESTKDELEELAKDEAEEPAKDKLEKPTEGEAEISTKEESEKPAKDEQEKKADDAQVKPATRI
jgi:hypothetical protein